MDKYLTASEANKIAKENNEDSILKNILEEIKVNAEKGKFELITRKGGFGEGNYYVNGLSDREKRVISKLQELGYKPQMIVEEK